MQWAMPARHHAGLPAASVSWETEARSVRCPCLAALAGAVRLLDKPVDQPLVIIEGWIRGCVKLG